jgi:hypothetical protein
MDIPPREKDILEINIGVLKHRMNSLDEKYNQVYNKYFDITFNEDDDESASFHLNITYLAYSSLCQMYRNFVKALEGSSGPEIEEYD